MADVNSAASSGPVLSYTNDRGWNDPPSFAFSPNSTGNRKRIDPRKRVAHNISTLGNGNIQTQPRTNGFQSPQPMVQPFQAIQPQPTMTPPPQPMTQPIYSVKTQLPESPIQTIQTQPKYPQSPQPIAQPFQTMHHEPATIQSHVNGMVDNFQQLSFAQGQMHHASSNPDIHQMPNLYPLHHSTSVPNRMNKTGQNRIPGHMPGTMTPPPSGSSTPPFVQMRSGSATPPHSNTQSSYSPSRKLSVPTLPYANSIFDQHGTPTMLQSSHLISKPYENGITSNLPSNQTSPSNLMINNQLTSNPYKLPSQSSPQSMRNSFSPVQSCDQSNQGLHNYSGDQGMRKLSPTNAPPPTAGYYARRVSSDVSPKASPIHSGHNSPIPPLDSTLLENDREALTNTLQKLNSCREKCMCKVTNKVNDDIIKKVKVFESAWISGKLSLDVKGKLIQLTDALLQNDFQMCERLQKNLLRNHSNEISSWFIGIKKLITCYQDAALNQ